MVNHKGGTKRGEGLSVFSKFGHCAYAAEQRRPKRVCLVYVAPNGQGSTKEVPLLGETRPLTHPKGSAVA